MLNTTCNHDQTEPHPEDESPVLLCEDICFPEGDLSRIYIGPCGIFAVCSGDLPVSTDKLYQAIRTRLGIPKVRLYVPEHGIYDQVTGTFTPVSDDPSGLLDLIFDWTTKGRIILAGEPRQRLAQRCYEITGYTKGEYIGEDGVLYLRRANRFLPCSDKDPDKLFWLTVLGSCVGAHRFYLGKFFSGMLYLLTCGLCGAGWIFDLFSLLTGHVTDAFGRAVRKPAPWRKKLLAAPLGLAAAIVSLFLFARLLSVLGAGFTDSLYDIAGTPSVSNFLTTFLEAPPPGP